MKSRSANPRLPADAAARSQSTPASLLFGFLLTVALAPALAQPPQPYPKAHAARGCTQEDAPALEIYITPAAPGAALDPNPPYLRFEVSAAAGQDLSGLTLQLQPLDLDSSRPPTRLARAEWVTPGHNSSWLTGTLTLDKAAPGAPIQGRYQVAFPSGRHWSRAFTIPYPTRPSVCG